MQRTATRYAITFSQWLRHFHFGQRSLPVAVADLVLVRCYAALDLDYFQS